MSDHEMMIISALRYALRRKSYIMGATEDYILEMLLKGVSDQFRHVAIEDIKTHYRDLEREEAGRFDGLLHNWLPLLVKLEATKE